MYVRNNRTNCIISHWFSLSIWCIAHTSSTLLQLSNYSSYEGVLYCKPHFDQLFKMTGSLDKSFEGYITTRSSVYPHCLAKFYYFLSSSIHLYRSQGLQELPESTDLLRPVLQLAKSRVCLQELKINVLLAAKRFTLLRRYLKVATTS